MPTNEEFKNMILEFLKKYEMSDYSFGIKANNDSRLVHDLRKGREFGEAIKTKVIEFMTAYEQEQFLLNAE